MTTSQKWVAILRAPTTYLVVWFFLSCIHFLLTGVPLV